METKPDFTRKAGVITDTSNNSTKDFSITRKDKDGNVIYYREGINAAKRKSRELQRTGNTLRVRR